MATTPFWLVVLFYSVTAAIITVNHLRGRTQPSEVGWWLVAGIWVLHAVTYTKDLLSGGAHLVLNLDYSLEGMAMAIAMVYLIDWRWRRDEARTVGLLLLPLVVLLLLASRLVPQSAPIVRELANPLLIVHLVLSLTAYGLFTVAAILALIDIYQQRALRTKDFSHIFTLLPPLHVLEQRLFFILHTGFVLLTLSIITGAVYYHQQHGAMIIWTHKSIFSWATWWLFGGLLVGHRIYGWRGRLAAKLTLWGYLLLILAYFGVKVVQQLILHRPI